MDLLAMALAKKAAAEKTLENKKAEVPVEKVEPKEMAIPPFDESSYSAEDIKDFEDMRTFLEENQEADIPPFVPPVETSKPTSLLSLLGTSPLPMTVVGTETARLPPPTPVSANILAATKLLKERMAEEGTKVPLFVPSSERTGIIPDGFQFILDQLAEQQEGYGTWLIQMHKQLAEDPALLHILSDADRRLMYVRALDETRKQTASVTKKAAAKSEKKVKEIATEQVVLDAFKDF